MAVLDGQPPLQKQSTDPREALPPELLIQIFCIRIQDAFDDPILEYNSPPTCLCRVSKSWKDFVFSLPVLWTYMTIDASEGIVTNLTGLEKQLERSQNKPLFVNITVGEHPHMGALRALFAECSRFRKLELDVLDLSWWRDIAMEDFTKLEHLVVTDMDTGAPVHEDELSAVFSFAPRLHSVEWYSTSDPMSIKVIGHRLHFLNLSSPQLPVMRVLEILAACPYLRRAAVFMEEPEQDMEEPEQDPTPLRERILLPDLCSLYLSGSRHLACLLGSIKAPRLSHLDVDWAQYDGQAYDLEALRVFLEYSPHLMDIALQGFLEIEHGLINIITNNKKLVSLSVTGKSGNPGSRKLITDKTFKLLTRQGDGEYELPRLERLEFQCGLDVPDEVVLRMIESRMSPPDDSSGSREAPTLKYICLDRCEPMAAESIFRLEAICQKNGLEVKGAFASRNQGICT